MMAATDLTDVNIGIDFSHRLAKPSDFYNRYYDSLGQMVDRALSIASLMASQHNNPDLFIEEIANVAWVLRTELQDIKAVIETLNQPGKMDS